MKRLPSCSFIFFSAVVCPGRGAVVTGPWKIELYAAAGSHTQAAGRIHRNREGKDEAIKLSIVRCKNTEFRLQNFIRT